MKHNIKILLDGSKYDGYEYYDVDDNAVKAVRHLMETQVIFQWNQNFGILDVYPFRPVIIGRVMQNLLASG